jgi:hypothetical protein
MKHGLGDNVQLTSLINHLKYYWRDTLISVEARTGSHSCFYGVADAVHEYGTHPETNYEKTVELLWTCPEPNKYWLHTPSTKVTRCLREVFGYDAIESLCCYTIHPNDDARERVAKYIHDDLADHPFAVIHTEGDSSREKKDLNNIQTRNLIDFLQSHGLEVVILDWHYRTPFAYHDRGGKCVYGPYGTRTHNPSKQHWLWDGCRNGDGGIITELTKHAVICFGIDSGPGHCAAATSTPTVIYWKDFHPIHNFDLSHNCLHLVPSQLPYCDYFENKYDHNHYTDDPFINLPNGTGTWDGPSIQHYFRTR